MQISNNRINQASLNQNFQVRTNRTRGVEKNYDAFRIELSTRALLSDEYNNPDYSFPIHNSEALQYTKQMKVLYRND